MGRGRWFAAVAALVGLMLVPSAAGRAHAAHRALTVVTATIEPVVNSDPRTNPPHLGGTATFRVLWSPNPGPCSQVTAKMTVTGPNAQVKTDSTMSLMSYTGSKAGIDTVKFTFSKSVCAGLPDFTIVVSGNDTFNVGWGQDAWQMGLCSTHHPYPSQTSAWLKAFKSQCVDDPVAEGAGIFELSTVDASFFSPGLPFILERTYNSRDDRGWFLGNSWSMPYANPVGGDANTLQFYGGDGQRFLFQKNADGTWSPLDGETATLTQSGSTYTLKFVDGTVWTYTGGNLTSISKNGQLTQISLGQFGQPLTVTLSNGKRINFSYDSHFNISRMTLPDGRFVAYTVNPSNYDLTSVTDLRGGVTQYGYDQWARLTTVTDPRGHVVVTNTYDTTNRLTSQTDALGNKTTYAYNGGCAIGTFGICAPPVVTVTDPRGNTWTDTYSVDGQLVSARDALGNTASWSYDAASGDPTGYTDPLGNTVAYQYDGSHNVTQTTLPGQITTGATYNPAGLLATSTNGRGNTTAYTYDNYGNPTQITEPGGATVNMTYNAAGQLTGVTDETAHTTSYGYDALGNRTSATTPLGNKTTYGYDTSGRVTSIVDPRGDAAGANPADYTTSIGYDAGDEVKTVTDPLGHVTTYSYDPDGNLSSVTDPNNHTWAYTYDADNRLTTVTAPDLTTTSYGYDAVGNLTSRTDANGHATLYTYDADNRLIEVVDALNRQWVLGYDADSNLISVTAPSGGDITYTYDALGRRTGVSYSDGTPGVGWTYDADGNRASMTDGAGTTSYTYDQLGRLTQATRGTDSFSYTYDAAGRVASRTYPDGTTTSYTYDNDGRMATAAVGAATTSYRYDPASNLTQTTLPNGVVESATYDHAEQLTLLNDGFRMFGYGYDPAGNVNSRTVGGVTTTDSYDALDRLTDITAPTGTIHYGYDAVGNRTSMTDATGPTSYTYDVADELTAATAPGGTTSYGYDANGNETAAGQWTYAVNLANQLAAATNGTDSVNYAYDGDGNRTTSTSGGETTSLLWDANFALPQLALEADSGGGLIRRYSYGVGRISMTTPQATAYYSTDALGSVTEMSGDKGAILGSYDTNPFGDGTSSSNVDPSAAGNPIGFVGEYRDPVTGLVNLRARNYDRTTGRFLSPDPLGPQDYASSYVYVADNPLGYTDPSGMKRGTCTSLKCWISSGGWEHLGPSGGLCGSWIGVAGPLVGASATGSSCLVWAHGPHGWSFGMTVTGGGGGGTGAGFFGSLGFMGSTATNVNQYGGTFVEGSVSGGAPVSGVATGFSGGIGNDVTGGYVGIGAGGVAAGSAAFTRTTVLCFYGCQR